jgi:phosphoglycolate phosphatase-like HAD superfamily hydrolase
MKANRQELPLPPASVELVNPDLPRGGFRVAVFDFDGTVSLIREGWSRLMADMGVELLSDPAAFGVLELEMLRLSGRPSVHQMERLRELAAERGKPAPTAVDLLAEFNRRLAVMCDDRRKALADGTDPPEAWAVPGTHELLTDLQKRGVHLVLASGTPIEAVRAEGELLKLTPFFGERVYAPEGASGEFTKRAVIENLLDELGVKGTELIGFGDGYAETVEVKRAGGVAIGLATVEAGRGGMNPTKRRMLLDLDADAVIPHYDPAGELAAWLFGEPAA